MAFKVLNFDASLNVSLQIGDLVYFSKVIGKQSGKNHPNPLQNTKPKKFGLVTGIDRANRQVTVNDSYCPGCATPAGYMWMFSKDRRANTSGVIGYYAETELRNWSTLPAEIFAVQVDFVESSK
tara:strand:- start:102 stop:473 length:372 start_codon:yes stop_codon:yes gene_type:complete